MKRTVFAAVLACVLPATDQADAQMMRASWYGVHDGSRHLTASGMHFNPYTQHIVAHKTLPFGTCLVLTNPKNGLHDRVTVQDRGPFVRGRELDVTLVVARKIGLQGVGLLDVRKCSV